jgi:hypothetical protein
MDGFSVYTTAGESQQDDPVGLLLLGICAEEGDDWKGVDCVLEKSDQS